MGEMHLSAIYRYPVKSLSGNAVQALDVGPRGLCHDRHWMLVDAYGRFLTQRQQPRMTLIRTRLSAQGGLRLEAPGMTSIDVDAAAAGDAIEVTVWHDRVPAQPVGAAVDAWLGDFLGVACRLVYLPADVVRPVDPAFAHPADQVGFADGFPFLLISQASLDDLNTRLAEPVEMLRFRPNLVISGCAPYAEDQWHRIRIGELSLRVAKPCSRCTIPGIDRGTGERGQEPLRTLAGYRRRDRQIFFGQNLIHDGVGRLAVGMPVEVLA